MKQKTENILLSVAMILAGLVIQAAWMMSANGATLNYLNGPVWDGQMAHASLDGGSPINILCIDSQNPIRLLSWSVQVLTLEQAAGANNRGFDLRTLQLIAQESAPMFVSGVFSFQVQRAVWRIGDYPNLSQPSPSFDYSGFRVLNPYLNLDQQLFIGWVLGDPEWDDPGERVSAPEPLSCLLVGAGLVWIGRKRRRNG